MLVNLKELLKTVNGRFDIDITAELVFGCMPCEVCHCGPFANYCCKSDLQSNTMLKP